MDRTIRSLACPCCPIPAELLPTMLATIAVADHRSAGQSPAKRKHCYRYPFRVHHCKPKTSISRALLKQMKRDLQIRALFLDILTTDEIAMYGL